MHRPAMRIRATFACPFVLLACTATPQTPRWADPVSGSSTDAGDVPGDDSGPHPPTLDEGGGPPNRNGGDGGAADAGLGTWHPATSGDAAADSSIPVQSFSASVGPLTIQAGQEVTYCITLRLPNPEAVFVPRMTAALAPGSHHLVVYRSQATAENLTPTPCTAFAGVLGGNAVPMMIAQKPNEELTFPQGVALKFAAGQMVELEAHYINATAAPIQGFGTVNFDSLPATTPNVIESDFAFFGTFNVAIPPNSTASVGPLFVTGITGTHGFAVTTHQHRLGTRFRIWAAQNATDTSHAPIADTTDWANAPLYRVNPEMAFDGTNGVAYQCEWNNTTSQLVTFGESALQEMCFMWMYYYPSHGFDFRTQ